MSDAGENEAAPEDPGSGGLLATIVPNFVRRSFALKFAIVLVVMGLSVGVVGVAATELVKANTQQNVEDEYESVASQEADIIEHWQDRNTVATQLSSAKPVWTFQQNLTDHLENEEQFLPSGVADIHIAEAGQSGTTIAASTSVRAGQSATLVGRAWLNNASFDGEQDVEMSSVFRAGGGTHRVAFMSPWSTPPQIGSWSSSTTPSTSPTRCRAPSASRAASRGWSPRIT